MTCKAVMSFPQGQTVHVASYSAFNWEKKIFQDYICKINHFCVQFQSKELKQFRLKFSYFVINFHSGKMWTVVHQKRALWLPWPLTLILTVCLFPMTSRAARATSVTPGQMTAPLTEPVVARREDRRPSQHPRSGLCQQNTPSRPTLASHRTASTLISLTREVSFTSF